MRIRVIESEIAAEIIMDQVQEKSILVQVSMSFKLPRVQVTGSQV